jgi:ABC-type nitrate/sulfonate/bicarbonate transport system substrate-binding protein
MVIHLGIALLSIMLTASTAVAQEKAKIYLGASSKTLGYSPLWVAAKKGFFEQQGLDFNWFSCAECR